MAQPALGNVYQIRAYCYDIPPIQLAVNTWYMQITDATGVGTMTEQSMTDSLSILWAARYKPCISNGSSYYGLSAQFISGPKPLPVALTSIAGQGIGTGGAGTLPNQVTGLISFKTALAGKHYRGRIYTPFLPKPAADVDGLMTTAFAAIITANMANFFPALESIVSGANSVTGAYFVRAAIQVALPPLPKTITYNRITRATVPVKFATIRRRGQFGRINPPPF
jgi:hypothetical protein